MITQTQIARLIEIQDHRQLIDRILANGRCRSLTAKRALSHPDVAPIASLGLALQRVSEITYRPAAIAKVVAAQLIDLQRADGLFGDVDHMNGDSLLAATAVAVRGLLSFAAQHDAMGMPLDHAIRAGIERGLAALAHRYESLEPMEEPVGWAIALWQLGDVTTFRAGIDIDVLLTMLDDSALDMLEDDLCRYAHAMAA